MVAEDNDGYGTLFLREWAKNVSPTRLVVPMPSQGQCATLLSHQHECAVESATLHNIVRYLQCWKNR